MFGKLKFIFYLNFESYWIIFRGETVISVSRDLKLNLFATNRFV